jgi:hypothetical protein
VTKHEISEVSMSHGGKPDKASSMICFIYSGFESRSDGYNRGF